MKKWTKRVLALAMSLTMVVSYITGVGAAEVEENRLCDLTMSTGYTVTPLDANDNVVSSVQEDVSGTTKAVFKNVAKLKLEFSGEVGEQYVVFLLNGTSQVPVEGNIRYIDQKTGIASMEFVIYPDQLTEPGVYNVAVANSTTYNVVGSVTVAEPPYKLGDVDDDGAITVADAASVLRYVAKLESFTETQKMAANVDNDEVVTVADAGTILRVVAKLESLA